MLGDDDERGRQDDEDGARLEDGMVERGQREPGCALDEAPVDDARAGRDDVAGDDADENRDDGEEALERDGGDDRDGERCEGDEDGGLVRLFSRESRHAGGCWHELEADDGDDGAHGGGWEDDVDPARADRADQQADEAEDDADDDEAAECRLITVLGEHEEDRREEREARAEIGGDAPLADDEVEDGADAVEEQHGGRVHLEKDRHEHSRAEHGEQVLQGERDGLEERQAFLDADGAAGRHGKHSFVK